MPKLDPVYTCNVQDLEFYIQLAYHTVEKLLQSSERVSQFRWVNSGTGTGTGNSNGTGSGTVHCTEPLVCG